MPLLRAGMTPISTCSSITLEAASIASTRSGVGGTIGRPSVQPFSKNVSWTSDSSSVSVSVISSLVHARAEQAKLSLDLPGQKLAQGLLVGAGQGERLEVRVARRDQAGPVG